MDNTYQSALGWLISERNITDTKDYERAADAIVCAAKIFPTYYREYPRNEIERMEKEIFQAEAIATFMHGRVGSNQLSIYQQDVIGKQMNLHRFLLKKSV